MKSEAGHDPGGIQRPNRLGGEKSPYLLQHAGNPVDWHAWGDEAFERARREHKPVFLSIGYSSCHWCHVMAHESFEDADVASLLNDSFVSVKVDREERPDIDGVYMDAAVLMSGRGGWPLTVMMTPDGAPFFAATYLPRESRLGMTGLLELLPRVAELWATRRTELVDTAARVAAALAAGAERPAGTAEFAASPGTGPDPDRAGLGARDVEAGCAALVSSFDERHGGFGDAPKFPTPLNLLYLLRCHERTGDYRRIEVVARTLEAMRLGGIYDHVGFGFHRYSTDARWLVPHFEKMLYDQALLLMAYTEAWRVTRDPLFERTARETAEYILRDLTDPGGGFYSAEDADSEGMEGRFYLWTLAELSDVLGEEANFVARRLGVRRNGNFTDEATGEASGANILHLPPSTARRSRVPGGDRARASGPRDDNAREDDLLRWEHARRKLFTAREARVRPGLDDKILTDWNGLAVAALARAGAVLNEPAFVGAAARAAEYVLSLARDDRGRLLHRLRKGEAGILGMADDYAFMGWGLIELYLATLEPARLQAAIGLMEDLVDRFWDKTLGGFLLTAHDGERLLARQRKVYDGAVPSGNSVAQMNLLRLSQLTGRPEFETRAASLMRAFGPDVRQHPAAHPHFLSGVDQAIRPAPALVIVGDPGAGDTLEMLDALRAAAPLGATLLLAPGNSSSPDRQAIERLAPFVSGMLMKDGLATAYVCHGRACSLPVTGANQAARLVSSRGPSLR